MGPFPRRFGSYLLLGPLGRGGMGEVYLGRRGTVQGAERLCVLKVMRTDVADAEHAARFLDEARLAVNLTHTNICHVFDVGLVGEELFIAMEHIAGIDLKKLAAALRAAGRALPPAYAIYVVGELLDALDYAHRRVHPVTQELLHVVHRDVSPQNVMVTFEGEVKLIDFGLAISRLKREETSNELVMGKLAYMSPEQMRGDAVDARTDQYASAIVLYELISGERFYGALDRSAVAAAALSGAFRPTGWAALSPALAGVLGRAVAGARDERFATCDELARALRGVLATEGMVVSRSSLRDLIGAVLPNAMRDHEAAIARLAQASADLQMPTTQQNLMPVTVVDEPTTGETREQPGSTLSDALPQPADTLARGRTEVFVRPRARRIAPAVFVAACAVAAAVVVVVALTRPADVAAPDPAGIPRTPGPAGIPRTPGPDAPIAAPTPGPASAPALASAPVTSTDAAPALAPVPDTAPEPVGPEPVGPAVAPTRGRVHLHPKPDELAKPAELPPKSLWPPAEYMWKRLAECKLPCASGLVLQKANTADETLARCFYRCSGKIP